MNLADAIILIFVAFFTYSGYRAGLLKKLFGIAGIVLGLVFAIVFLDEAKDILVFLTSIKGGGPGIKPPLSYVVAFLTTFATVFATFKVLYFMISSGQGELGKWQRGMGAVAGTVEGWVFMSIVLIGLNLVQFPPEDLKEGSLFYKPVLHLAPRIFDEVSASLPDEPPEIAPPKLPKLPQTNND